MVYNSSLQRAILSSNQLTDGDDSGKSRFDTAEGGVTQELRFAFSSPEEMICFLKQHPRIRFVDMCFNDPLGRWHHCTFTATYLNVGNLTKGLAFDASSIPMFEQIDKSDFVMIPDPSICFLDPFAAYPTLHCVADVSAPTGDTYEKCPRSILKGALAYLRSQGIADQAYFGPEAEFFVFNHADFHVDGHVSGFNLDGDEAYWNHPMNGEQKRNLAHRANKKEGYMGSRPVDRLVDLRSEMLLVLESLGIQCEKHHHEVATCQMELNIEAEDAVVAADNMQILKYVVKNVSQRSNKTATFMPKPLSCDNGSGMHCNQSLWKDGRNVFYDDKASFHELSEIAMHYMAGILHHCHALLAICCPTTNSYRRLVPDFEAPIHVTYSAGNRSTAIRVPTHTNEKSKRLEFRMPDPSCCPHLAFAAMIMAGIDGVVRKLPPPPIGVGNLFDESNPCLKGISRCPLNLEAALNHLEQDHEFLTRGGVFTEKFISSFLKYKRKESSSMQCFPHPQEFVLYYGV